MPIKIGKSLLKTQITNTSSSGVQDVFDLSTDKQLFHIIVTGGGADPGILIEGTTEENPTRSEWITIASVSDTVAVTSLDPFLKVRVRITSNPSNKQIKVNMVEYA